MTVAHKTINCITFKSDNLVLVNVTTGPTEGYVACLTMIASNLPKRFIVLGTVFVPASGLINVSKVSVSKNDKFQQYLIFPRRLRFMWNRQFDFTKNFDFIFRPRKSPLEPRTQITVVQLLNISDNSNKLRLCLSFPYICSIKISQ
jgi:hypothetical protein